VSARFLFVEDDRVLTRSIGLHLRPFGELVFVHTKAMAMSTLGASSSWRGLVIDVKLPDGSGLEVLEFARSRGCGCPALILTGSQDVQHINRAFDLGARYLVKPCDLDKLVDFVRDASRRGSPQVKEYASLWRDRYMLTDVEKMLLVETAEGASKKEILDAHGFAEGTLKRHVHNLLQKTGDASLLAAATRLLRERLGEPVPES
jgi:DNA-binding NarL/FixJ family response regulator